MCLIVKSGPFVAKKEKAVWKVFKVRNGDLDNLYSPYREKKYTRGKKYNARFGMETNFHPNKLTIHHGLHAFTNKNRAKRWCYYTNVVIVCMRIPKGGVYFLGEGGDIVSNCLLFPVLSVPEYIN